MGQYRTEQERIDAMTVQISNPNIVGSGYIQHPPQRPFERPLEMQPPTVAQFDFPAEYSRYNGGGNKGTSSNSNRNQPRRAEATYSPQKSGGYQQANGIAPHAQTNGRTAQPHHSSQRSNGGGAATPRTTPSNPKPRAAGPPRAVPQPNQPLPHQAQQGSIAGAHASLPAHSAATALPASPREETALLSLADNGRPAAATAEPEQEGPKLSKSQLMRLRKKKREGKM
ncbi:hypothetical protein WJX75_001363 [Coccomyxa subellipsoidea]|uniref:Uncharacterized protein n=1 Tax=Coccomyxa subellipsoidea TaxID=248742 RepID=A0ABR2YZ05_9CHLO